MRSVLVFAVAFLAARAARAQEEYTLASALAERGWYDLSEQLFGKMLHADAADVRAEGRYGLARIKILMAKNAEPSEEKWARFDEAIQEVEAFLKDFPNHRRRAEALSDIGDLYQSKGKALMHLAKADPAKTDEAEKAFSAAEKLFRDLAEQLKKQEPKRPEDAKDREAQRKHEAWEEKMMFAKYNYAISLFAHAETYKDNTSKLPDMKRLLEQMNAFLNNDFLWSYEHYLLAFDAFIYMGRAYQLLAEASERERAEDYWRQCLTSIAKPQTLLSDKANRMNEAVREIGLRALLFQVKAHLAYGDTKRGPTAIQEYAKAADLADNFFKAFPNARFEDMGLAVRLEQARAWCKAGQLPKGVQLLQDLKRQFKDSWVENIALDILGEYGADQSVSLAFEAANNLFERGPAYYYQAVKKYRKVLQAIKSPEEQRKYAAVCWYQIGRSYYFMNRPYEAATAFSMLEKPPLASSEQAPEAALRKLSAIGKIAKMTKDRADEKAVDDFRNWVTSTYRERAGKDIIRQTAVDYEENRNWNEAIKAWKQLLARPETELYEEAVFRVGLNLYLKGKEGIAATLEQKGGEREKGMKEAIEIWKEALGYFGQHLAHVDKMPAREPRAMKNAVGSIHFSTIILTHPRVDRADEALKISRDFEKRFPNADPSIAISIMWKRLDAKVKKGQVQEAEEDIKILEAKYEKESVGLESYINALIVLANAYEEAAEREKGKDAEKFDLYALKAADYYYQYYNLNPAKARNPEQMEAMADKLYMAAEQRTKMGEDRIGKDGVAQARDSYKKALDLYREFQLKHGAGLNREQERVLQHRILRCLIMTGLFDEAIQILKRITQDDPEMKYGSSHEDLADAYVAKARSLPRGPARNDFLREADKVYARLAALMMQAQTFNEHSWRLLYKHASAFYDMEDYDQLRNFYDHMDRRGYGGPDKWDADDKGKSAWGFQARFEELRKRLDAKLPPRK